MVDMLTHCPNPPSRKDVLSSRAGVVGSWSSPAGPSGIASAAENYLIQRHNPSQGSPQRISNPRGSTKIWPFRPNLRHLWRRTVLASERPVGLAMVIFGGCFTQSFCGSLPFPLPPAWSAISAAHLITSTFLQTQLLEKEEECLAVRVHACVLVWVCWEGQC